MTDYTVTIQESSFDVTVTGDTTTIVKQVIGGPHGHAVSDLWQSGATTGQVPTWSGTAWAPATPSGGGGGGVTDGDKGDIVVSGSGAVWSIDYTAVNATIAPTWANVTGKPTISGTNTGDQTSIVGITGTLAEFNAALTGDNFATGGGTATGSNTGDETAAGLLAKLLTVDGAGSGLDADLLDGQSSAAFATAAQGTLAASASQPGHTHAAADVAAPGSTTQVVYNLAGVLTGSANVEIENSQLRLKAIASPATPASGGVSLFGMADAGRTVPGFISQDGVARGLQESFARGNPIIIKPNPNNATPSSVGGSISLTGTATAVSFDPATVYGAHAKYDILTTVASSSAAAGFRGFTNYVTVGGAAAGMGGFAYVGRWGPATGVAGIATHRAMFGLWQQSGSPLDQQPSGFLSCVFMGWDDTDTEIQIMHNDAAGVCTKVPLGASFLVPTTDRSTLYELALSSPSGTSQSVSWLVKDLLTGATQSGVVTVDLPATSYPLTLRGQCSVGGTSSVVGLTISSLYLLSNVN